MILVSGYYGYHNSGDEAILAALCRDLANLGISSREITVLSGDPAYTEKTHQVAAVFRYNPLAVIDALGNSRVLISGGGSLLQDATSWRTIPYYLGIIQIALAFGLKVVVYGQGIGPVKNRLYQRWIAELFNRAEGIAVRDPISAQLLQEWGVEGHLITTAADPVFGMELEPGGSGYDRERDAGITINLRPYSNWEREYPHWISLIKNWSAVFQLPMRFAALGPGDLTIGLALQRAIPQLEVIQASDWHQACQLMGQSDICVSMRLHGLIFAARSGSVPVGLSYDPKISALGSQLGIPICPPVPDVRLTNTVADLLANRAAHRQSLTRKVEELCSRSEQNRSVLAAVLQSL